MVSNTYAPRPLSISTSWHRYYYNEAHAPYDAIHVGASAPSIPEAGWCVWHVELASVDPRIREAPGFK